MAVGGGIAEPTLGLALPGRNPVDLRACPLYPASMATSLALAAEWLAAAQIAPYDVSTRRGEAKFVLLTEAPGTGEQMLRFVLRSREGLSRLQIRLAEFLRRAPALSVVTANLLPEHRASTEGPDEILLTDTSAIRCVINGHTFWLPPQAFLQTNSTVAAALYRTACDWLAHHSGVVWDLYCGIGVFANHLVRADREIVAIESSHAAVNAGRRLLTSVRYVADDATQFALSNDPPDVAVVNPPRAGLSQALCRWLDCNGPQALLYSSCNPETLGRDLNFLQKYCAKDAKLFDMFPHTRHAEILVRLERAA